MSVSAMCDARYQILFYKLGICVCKNFKLVAQVHRVKGLYYLCTPPNMFTVPDIALMLDMFTWHTRLPHVNVEFIKRMSQNILVL